MDIADGLQLLSDQSRSFASSPNADVRAVFGGVRLAAPIWFGRRRLQLALVALLTTF